MNIISIGVDLCDIPRLEKLIAEHGERFLKKVYTPLKLPIALRKLTGF